MYVETRQQGALGVFTVREYPNTTPTQAVEAAHAEGLETRGVCATASNYEGTVRLTPKPDRRGQCFHNPGFHGPIECDRCYNKRLAVLGYPS